MQINSATYKQTIIHRTDWDVKTRHCQAAQIPRLSGVASICGEGRTKLHENHLSYIKRREIKQWTWRGGNHTQSPSDSVQLWSERKTLSWKSRWHEPQWAISWRRRSEREPHWQVLTGASQSMYVTLVNVTAKNRLCQHRQSKRLLLDLQHTDTHTGPSQHSPTNTCHRHYVKHGYSSSSESVLTWWACVCYFLFVYCIVVCSFFMYFMYDLNNK